MAPQGAAQTTEPEVPGLRAEPRWDWGARRCPLGWDVGAPGSTPEHAPHLDNWLAGTSLRLLCSVTSGLLPQTEASTPELLRPLEEGAGEGHLREAADCKHRPAPLPSAARRFWARLCCPPQVTCWSPPRVPRADWSPRPGFPGAPSSFCVRSGLPRSLPTRLCKCTHSACPPPIQGPPGTDSGLGSRLPRVLPLGPHVKTH